ncbi:MAG: 30S ribosomal protein S21 [Dehalococcoidia bacterium]|nr:MAG: 30S ribosomal protein S21 [Dehalococcoidia bacterium]
MTLQVSRREGETQDSLLRRFQRMVQVSGILREVKAHHYFLSKGGCRLSKQERAQEEGDAADK